MILLNFTVISMMGKKFGNSQRGEERSSTELHGSKHRDRSIHIERECCLGPALADIWLLLR